MKMIIVNFCMFWKRIHHSVPLFLSSVWFDSIKPGRFKATAICYTYKVKCLNFSVMTAINDEDHAENKSARSVGKRDGLFLALVMENLYDLCSTAADGTTHRRELLCRLRDVFPDWKLQDREAVQLIDQVITPFLIWLLCYLCLCSSNVPVSERWQLAKSVLLCRWKYLEVWRGTIRASWKCFGSRGSESNRWTVVLAVQKCLRTRTFCVEESQPWPKVSLASFTHDGPAEFVIVQRQTAEHWGKFPYVLCFWHLLNILIIFNFSR